MKKLNIIFLLVWSACWLAQAQSALPATAQKAMNAIDAEKIRATVKYLADDALQGRGTGQKGGDMAAARDKRAAIWQRTGSPHS